MKFPEIILGFSELSRLETLIAEGVTEFYTGLMPTDDLPLFNHRWETATCNLAGTEELRQAASLCHEHGRKLLLAVNEPHYPPGSYDRLVEVLGVILEASKVDGVIVADFYLLQKLSAYLDSSELETRLHLSSLASCFDQRTYRFYSQFGVKRVVFPQLVFAREVAEIFELDGIETEAFYHVANDCRNIDGRCYGCYLPGLTGRQVNTRPCHYKFRIWNQREVEDPDRLYAKWGKSPGINSYSNLYDFVEMGVTSVKIGNRMGQPLEVDVRLVRHLKKVLSLILESEDKDSFLERFKDGCKN